MPDPRTRRTFLITTWEGGGSVGPVLTVARKLVEAGHDVRVMSDACNRPEAEAIGARFVPWTRAPSRTDRSRESEILRDWEAASPAEGVASVIMGITAGPALEYARDVIGELEREPADLVVSSELILGASTGCEAMGQPFAVLSCNSIVFPIAGAPQAGPPISSEQEQAMAELMEGLGAVFERGLGRLNAARAELGLGPLEALFDQLAPARKFLIGVNRTFDFGPESDPPGFAYIGPQLDEVSWIERWTSPWPAGDSRPLVLVGFSTTFQNHVGVLQRVIDALGQLRVRALVTLGPTISPGELDSAGNVELVRSAPHDAVMQDAALLVTHGGHGTVARGLRHRLPMLVIPHGRDQDGNAARIVAHGAGLSLPPTAATEQIRGALAELLGKSSYAEAAARLGDEIARESGATSVVRELEALCERPRA